MFRPTTAIHKTVIHQTVIHKTVRRATPWLLCCLFLALAPAVMAEEITLDQVLALNLESRGGDALEGVETMRMIGTMTMGPGMEAPFTVYFQRPHKMRLEFTMQGMTGIQAFDGSNGWFVMPFMGNPNPQKMADDQLKQTREMADFDGPLIGWKDKGYSVELLGKTEIEGTEAYELKITTKDGDVTHTYLDTDYGLEFKQTAKRSFQGVEVEAETSIGDYKEVGDIVVAHSMETRIGNAPAGQVITIKEIDLNVEVTDDMFDMPEPSKADPTGHDHDHDHGQGSE